MEDARLASSLAAAAETERAIRFHLDTETSPLELDAGWKAYRYVVGLRKALETWTEMRVAKTTPTNVHS